MSFADVRDAASIEHLAVLGGRDPSLAAATAEAVRKFGTTPCTVQNICPRGGLRGSAEQVVTVKWAHDVGRWGLTMDAFGGLPEDDRNDEDDTPDINTPDRAPIDNEDHEKALRLLTAENVEAAMDLFFEAKDPNIDPALKLKLIGLASKVGDNARKGIATCAACFGARS